MNETTLPEQAETETISVTVPPEAPKPTFADLGVRAEIVESLARKNITHPFPIQAMSLPIAMAGTDMIGQARTGTGKTLAFGIAVLEQAVVPTDPGYADLKYPGKPQALIMTPTRELALQITGDLKDASQVRHARILTVYGGVGYEPQLEA
ncbi:MAG: DEAD/DEAH box helicase, partial [Propioniciclava sp.]|nr:DEAD/DEAH box helicase [Propioniciclava sp.]